MRREGLAGKMRVRLLVGEEAEKATVGVAPDVVVMCRPADAWCRSSLRRVASSSRTSA